MSRRAVRGQVSSSVRYVIMFGKAYAAVVVDGKIKLVPVVTGDRDGE